MFFLMKIIYFNKDKTENFEKKARTHNPINVNIYITFLFLLMNVCVYILIFNNIFYVMSFVIKSLIRKYNFFIFVKHLVFYLKKHIWVFSGCVYFAIINKVLTFFL